MPRLLAIAAALVAVGCPAPRGPAPAPRPRVELPPPVVEATRATDGAMPGQTRRAELPARAGQAVGVMMALLDGAEVEVSATGPTGAHAVLLGPAVEDGSGSSMVRAADLVAGGPVGAPLRARVPASGAYLVAVVGRGAGGPIEVSLRCVGECRLPCGEANECPPSSTCALAACAGEPCVSYCAGGPPVEAPPPRVCGTRGAAACEDGEYCAFGADCGATDRGGSCQPRPRICTRDWRPVCGCDGRTYGNACSAAAAGASVQRPGPCEPPG